MKIQKLILAIICGINAINAPSDPLPASSNASSATANASSTAIPTANPEKENNKQIIIQKQCSARILGENIRLTVYYRNENDQKTHLTFEDTTNIIEQNKNDVSKYIFMSPTNSSENVTYLLETLNNTSKSNDLISTKPYYFYNDDNARNLILNMLIRTSEHQKETHDMLFKIILLVEKYPNINFTYGMFITNDKLNMYYDFENPEFDIYHQNFKDNCEPEKEKNKNHDKHQDDLTTKSSQKRKPNPVENSSDDEKDENGDLASEPETNIAEEGKIAEFQPNLKFKQLWQYIISNHKNISEVNLFIINDKDPNLFGSLIMTHLLIRYFNKLNKQNNELSNKIQFTVNDPSAAFRWTVHLRNSAMEKIKPFFEQHVKNVDQDIFSQALPKRIKLKINVNLNAQYKSIKRIVTYDELGKPGKTK